jgi:hypothetical protein
LAKSLGTRRSLAGPFLALVLAAHSCSSDSAPAPAHRDWAAQPAIVQLDSVADTWVLGDVHGDYQRMVALLARAGLVRAPSGPDDAEWRGGTAMLVCLGDLIDKWTAGYDAIIYLAALQASAVSQGGLVVVLMGNHDATFLANPADSKVADFADELRRRGMAPVDVAAGRDIAGQFLRGLPFAVRINQWFFVHAGNTDGASISKLDASITSQVEARGFGAPILSRSDSILEAEPPWWESGASDSRAALASIVAALGVEHVVQGHKPGKIQFSDGTTRPAGSIFQKFGLIYFADVGMSRGVDESVGALLHIVGASAEVFYANGTTGPVQP